MQGVIIKALSGFYYVKTETETAACPALDRFAVCFHVIEAAQGFDYDALHQFEKK